MSPGVGVGEGGEREREWRDELMGWLTWLRRLGEQEAWRVGGSGTWGLVIRIGSVDVWVHASGHSVQVVVVFSVVLSRSRVSPSTRPREQRRDYKL